MNFFYNRLGKALSIALLVFTFNNQVKAQTTLATGDIAFTGYHATPNAPDLDAFSFVLLTNVTANTVIHFTDNAWGSNSIFRAGETTVTLTFSAARNAGTEIIISGPPGGAATATLALGGSAGTCTGTTLSLSVNGDQVIAYQSAVVGVAPFTFISAIHMNVYSGGIDPSITDATNWDNLAAASQTANSSFKPTGLVTGTNAIWIGTSGDNASERNNARFNCTTATSGGANLTTAAGVRAACNNPAFWDAEFAGTGAIPTWPLPSGCTFISAPPAPSFTLHPASTTICEGATISFPTTATGALTYQWQVDIGGGFLPVTNDATYSGATTSTLTITNATVAMSGYIYRNVATNGGGPTNSNPATLTVTALPVNPTLLLKSPLSNSVADGTNVSATFTAGSGGTGCSENYEYTINGGISYLPYTPGSNISTTGVSTGSGMVFIRGRRASCSSLCQNSYVVLASWQVTPFPAGPTTLVAGDLAFSGYIGGNNVAVDEFTFVLLRHIGPGTVINFTDRGWLSTNVFGTNVEETVTWTSPGVVLTAGTEIKIAGLTASRTGGGAAGSVGGTALTLSVNGDQILAYQGAVGTPPATFISAIHMNVYSVTAGDPAPSTNSAAWDGTGANTFNGSALPTGLTTGTNAIWIGTEDVTSSEYDNAKFGLCTNPAVPGDMVALRLALNNQANWIRSNGGDPASFSLPTGCNYLNVLVPSINVTGTPLAAFTSCSGTPSAEQNFVVSGNVLTTDIVINAPVGFEISITSGSGFASSLTLTQSGGSVPNTTIYVRLSAAATGTPSGNITLASTGVTSINVAVTGTVNPIPATPTITPGGPTTFCTGGSVTLTSSSATGNLWSTAETTQSIVVTTGGTYTVTVTSGGCTSAPSAGTTVTVNPLPATPTITAGGPTTFCTGGSVTLTSSSATGNLWSTAETTQSIVVTTGGTYTVTVTSGGCTSAPSAGTTVTVDALPTTADAGPDATACVSPGTFTMAANVPVVGTGSWSQAPGGPATAIIFTPGSATSNIGGLTTPGVYTFVWTISNGSCPPSTDIMTITVNTNPAPFTLTGGGTFCPGTTTLTGPVDPNYTYTWQRSLSGIANPNSFTSFGGTTSTQDVTSSGNYRLIVTNQFGCSTSDTTPVSMADYVFNGSLAPGDAQQTGRLNRFAVLSTCAAPKTCPGTFTTTGARFYDSYSVTNIRNVPVCATIGLKSECGTSLFNVAYLGSFNPAALCTNYLADPGSSFPGTGYMEVTIPANATIVVVVHEVNPGTGCANYQLTVDVPREAGVTVNPSTPICSATPVTLTAPVASSYSWNPGGNTTQAITVSPAATTEYFVTLGYGNNGCTGLDSATVTINPLPTTADAGLDAAVCGLTYTLAGNTPTVGTGTWTLVTGPGTANFTNANLATSDVTVSANGVYTFRWTIATGAPCPNSAQDDVIVNFAGTPSVADAGIDKTACVSPGRTTMTAAVPTVGTGVWSQVSGPVTANIISPSAPNTNITGLTTVGTYTFRWTVSNNPCPSNFDEVNVVVNVNPASFTITGGGTFCPSGTTLAGPVDPNYTYQWGKSYLTAPFTGVGTAQTLAVTSSGIYELVVTNQFGCSTSNTTVVNAADYVFNGSLVTGDAVQTGRLNRFAAISTCAAPKVCPGTFTTTGSRLYDTYTITNPRSVPVCAVIGLNSGCGTAIFSVAYSGSYDPNALCTNYLADPGSSPSTSIFYEATIPGNSSIVIVVHEVNPGTGCANYTLTVDVPRDLAPIIANPPSVLCNGTSTLTAPVANSYLWSPGGATTRSIVTPPLFVPTQFNVTLGYGNNGCSREDSVTVGVTSLPPTIICPANISLSNTTGQCGRIVTYSPTVGGLPTPTETYTFTGATTGAGAGNGSGSFFNIGTTNVVITATNACGTVSCTFTVTINDTENPTITCPAPVTVSCAAAVPVPNTGSVTASDNCPGYVVTHQGDVISGQTCANRYTVTRTYRVTDPSGNFAECTQIITVNDQTPPVLTCPAAVTVSCASAVPPVNIAAVTGVSDNCAGVVTVTHQGDVISAQTCANRFTITRTYRATDVCGNFAECTQIITVNDQTPPVLTCPAPITVSCASAVPAVNIASVTGVSDNCAGVVTVTHQGDVISAQTCANRFTITRTYRATDVCGNFAECTQIITVNDQTAPVVTCPAAVTVSCAAAVPAVNIASVTATDNCAGVITITHVGDVISNQTCLNRFTITRTYRATDVCGNSATCTQIITVNDQTAPVITCSPNLTATTPIGSCTAVVNFTVTATDNCAGPVTVVSSPASGTAFPIGVTTVTSTATDACGNSSTCTFTVTVLDGQLPVISSQPANRTICSGLNASFSVTATNVVTYQWQQWNGNAWVNITGANAATFTLNSVTVSQNTNTYRVVLNGLCTVVNSNAATLYVNPPSTVTIAAAPPSILPNQTSTLTATGVPPGGTYAWTLNGAAVAGVTGAVLGPLNINQLGTYRVVYTSPAGCISTSADLTITGAVSTDIWVYPNPNFGQFQVRFYNLVNEAATVNVYDALGQKVYERRLVTGNTAYTQIDIDLGFKANGIYIVELVNGSGQRIGTKRINVQSK